MIAPDPVTNTDVWSHLPGFISALVSLFWFILAVAAFWKFKGPLKDAIDARSLSVDIGGFKLSFAEATDGLKKQVTDLQSKVSQLASQLEDVPTNGSSTHGIGKLTDNQPPKFSVAKSERIEDQESGSTTGFHVLWVDDNPRGNAYEIASIQSQGGTVDTARSTAEGLSSFQNRHYAAVITDMGRREDGSYKGDAGLQLIKDIREQHNNVPIFVYTSTSQVSRKKKQVEDAGANGLTASPVELLEMLHRSLYP
jgi:CheY-like chemotaxis protein